MKDNLIGVTGATGELGGRIAARLAERGVVQRLSCVTRRGRRSCRTPRLCGVLSRRRGGDAPRAGGSADAVSGVGGEAFDRVKLHTTAVGAVVAAGVERVVYLSFLNAAPDATFTFARDHFHTEHVRSTGVRHALSRPNIYLYYATFFCTA